MPFHIITSILLFALGMCGVFLSRKNVILTIMSLEIMLLAVNFNLLFFSTYLDDVIGHMFILFVLTVGASESAIGLSLVIAYYKHYE
jgi:NADH-quinone oxidoreductase subunit K